MNVNDLWNVQWLEPSHSVPSPSGLEQELAKEVHRTHLLFGLKAISVGRRQDNDDVLFFLRDAAFPLAVVHLAWTGRREVAECPWTDFYASLEDWIRRRMEPDHTEFIWGE